MRYFLVAVVAFGILTTSPASGETLFPYKGFITTGDVYIRSGPGQSYYPTDKLEAGDVVEVYRYDPGGWYAIRPTQQSFTWISGRYLTGGVDNLAVVTADGVAARVGSRFSDIRDVIQVRLHKGEVVEVLDKLETGAGAERKTWYKIAPPSGEFRWVFGEYVDPDYPADGLRKPHAAESRSVQYTVGGDSVADASSQEPPAFERQSVAASPPDEEVLMERTFSPEEYQAELQEIDLTLSTMLAEEPTVWSFDELLRRAESLLDQAETAVERGRARILLGKMERLADIQERYRAMAAMRRKIDRTNRQLAVAAQTDRSAEPGRDAVDDRFDGKGRLAPVVSPKLGAPRYALVDEDGQVRCYVSPTPGVNLRPYLGRQIGVTGTRGYMPEQRAQHVMARHVTPLDASTLR